MGEAQMKALTNVRRARRRPTEIEVVELTPGFYQQLVDESDETAHRILPWNEGPILLRGSMGGAEVWNELHEGWIGLTGPDDVLRIDKPGDVYPIDRATFTESYDFVEEGT